MIAIEPQKTSIINPIDELHNKAMYLADEAFYAKRKGDMETTQKKYKAAFEYEKAAAMLLINSYETEPSRSVLFRSAACLLLNWRNYIWLHFSVTQDTIGLLES